MIKYYLGLIITTYSIFISNALEPALIMAHYYDNNELVDMLLEFGECLQHAAEVGVEAIDKTVPFEEPHNVLLLVLSQSNKYHLLLAEDLRQNILLQAQQLHKEAPAVILSHETFADVGDWTVLPIMPELSALFSRNTSWVIICNDNTRFKISKLIETLGKYDDTKEVWLGYGLYDREPTIIHHFQLDDDKEHFIYPHLASGFAISTPLLKKLAKRVKKLSKFQNEFSIDAYHELALFVWEKGKGIRLIHEPAFCVADKPECASYVKQFSSCGDSVSINSLYVAVKTCDKFHKDRVSIVQSTWAKHVKHIGFYSNINDVSIPTINLGVPNTEHGHCGKTTTILKHVSKIIHKNSDIKWAVIVDDDTILSPRRLQAFLSCFDPDEKVAIGERYGYLIMEEQGYNYITGGGGMVFSTSLVHYLALPGVCECPTNASPDDMYIGVCLARSAINVTHSSMFHQARPNDYAPEYLLAQKPVSFHKHWMINPVSVYNEWFAEDDSHSLSNINNPKIEL